MLGVSELKSNVWLLHQFLWVLSFPSSFDLSFRQGSHSKYGHRALRRRRRTLRHVTWLRSWSSTGAWAYAWKLLFYAFLCYRLMSATIWCWRIWWHLISDHAWYTLSILKIFDAFDVYWDIPYQESYLIIFYKIPLSIRIISAHISEDTLQILL